MKREFIHITDNNKHRLMSDSGFWHGSTNKNSRDKMKKILSMAVLNELTERQRICIVDYYLNGKKEKEIATRTVRTNYQSAVPLLHHNVPNFFGLFLHFSPFPNEFLNKTYRQNR